MIEKHLSFQKHLVFDVPDVNSDIHVGLHLATLQHPVTFLKVGVAHKVAKLF